MMILSPAAHQARAAALAAALAGGSLRIYSAPVPDPGGSPGGILLVQLPITSATASEGGTDLTFESALASGSGAPAWCRLTDQTGDWLLDGDVGAVGSGALVELDLDIADWLLYAGGEINILTARILDG